MLYLSSYTLTINTAFGAYDVLLRSLGVRDSPKSGDYALSLMELNRELGTSRLNANELKSVIEVVSLAASNDLNVSEETIFAPDLDGKLVSIKNLFQNDQPWLVNSHRLDLRKIHLCHPKMSGELLNKLQIPSMSQHVHEILDHNSILTPIPDSNGVMKTIEDKLRSDEFISILIGLLPKNSHGTLIDKIKKLSFLNVEGIKTRLILVRNIERRNAAIDVTNHANSYSTFCFIDKERVLVSKLPVGVSIELVVATAFCDRYKIPRQHVGGITAILSSSLSNLTDLQLRMGLYGDVFHGELMRGDPGQPLVSADSDVAVLKPLKIFKQGEIVAIKSPTDSSQLIYGIVSEFLGGTSLSRLSVSIGAGKEKSFLTSEVYSLDRSKGGEGSTSVSIEEIDVSFLESNLIAEEEENQYENVLVNEGNKPKMVPVKRSEILLAVQDLLQAADLSLNQNTKKMLDSNLSLREALSQKDNRIKAVENQTNEIVRKAMKSVDSFLCPITREPMTDPVICCDGHTYERSAIEVWLRNNSRSPKTNQPLASKELIPNHALRSAIDSMEVLRESITATVPDWEEE